MVDAKDKEKVIEMIRDIVNTKKSQDKDVDLSALIKSVAPNDTGMANNLPMLMLLMNNSKSSGGGMDKLTEVMSTIAAINMLSKIGGTDKDSNRDIIDYIDRKLESLKPPKEEISMDKIAQIVASSIETKLTQKQAEENNNKILMTLLQNLTNAPKEAQPSIVDTIKVVAELMKPQQQNSNAISPLDALDRIGGMYERIAQAKEDNSRQMQDLTAEYNQRLMDFIKENRQNASVMDELKKSAQTVNGIKEFAKENLGLKDFSSAPKDGEKEPQWKTILDAVNNTLATVLPVVTNGKKPAKNPNLIDIDAEANRLYDKYKDYIPTDEITIEDFKAELQSNPDLEKTLDGIVKKKQAEANKPPKSEPAQQPVVNTPIEQPQPQQPQTKKKEEEQTSGISIG